MPINEDGLRRKYELSWSLPKLMSEVDPPREQYLGDEWIIEDVLRSEAKIQNAELMYRVGPYSGKDEHFSGPGGGGRWEEHLSTGAVGGFARRGRRPKKQSETPTVALLERRARVGIPLGLQNAAKIDTAEEAAFSMIRDIRNEVEKEFEANNKHAILGVNRARNTPTAGLEHPPLLDRKHLVFPTTTTLEAALSALVFILCILYAPALAELSLTVSAQLPYDNSCNFPTQCLSGSSGIATAPITSPAV